MRLTEEATKKAQLRAAMNTIKGLMKDKSLPKKIQDALEACDAHFSKTWEDMTQGGADDNPENQPQGKTESMHESMTIGTRLEGNIHTAFTDMVDDLYEQGALTRDEYTALHGTITDIMDAFYTAIMQDCPQLYDRSPWMDAPDPQDDAMMEAIFNEGKTEGGKDFPASDYAYVPDPEKPSTWKLRLTSKPGGDPDPGIVGAAAAALGKGFRGKKVQIPSGDLAKVKAKVRAAWKKANPDKSADDMPDGIKESAPLAEADNLQLIESDFSELVERSVRPDGTAPIKIIQPGWGSSGYYPPEVLARDGPNVFKSGMQMFWNHQTAEEEAARPEGDLNGLAAKLVTDARWDPNHVKGPGLYADAQIYQPYQEAIDDMGPDIGVSIRARGEAKPGNAEGRQGPIISRIADAKSVDFVTKPGAGGAVLQLFESARRGAAQPTIQEGDKTMDEKALKEVQEANAQLKTQLEQLQEKMILRDAGDYAAKKLAVAPLHTATKDRLKLELVKTAPVKEGKIDFAAFDAKITEAIQTETAYLVEVTGGGQITGMGGTGEPAEPKPEEVQKSMKESYMDLGYTEKMAEVMAKGR
jgi:hypothetical protein